MSETSHSLARSELGPVLVVSLIASLRLLGVFLVLPIFSVYGLRYPGATVALVGVAFGIYALAQCMFQIPLGWASDRWGRRAIVVLGLALFALGSVACALAGDIHELIFGRALQGSAAVGSVALAALADLTRPTVRSQAFTITGLAVGAAFIIGTLGGPILAAGIGLSGVFYLLAALSLLSAALAAICFPRDAGGPRQALPLRPILGHDGLRPIFTAAFVLSFVLNSFFFTYPLNWTELGLDRAELWKVYCVIFLPSALFVFPYVRYAEKRGRLRLPTLVGWLAVTAGYVAYLFGARHALMLYISGAAFFFGYSLFQPVLPAFLTQRLPPAGRGTATAVYTFFGFVGSSIGGMSAGALVRFSPSLPEILGLALLVAWYFFGLPEPPDSSS
ncbi:MAG TPA: MFS transporter [Candidatus Eisenbacteria bacterium]|nr:MFS transporter [Candidatus Eisenbacteria bacterium]